MSTSASCCCCDLPFIIYIFNRNKIDKLMGASINEGKNFLMKMKNTNNFCSVLPLLCIRMNWWYSTRCDLYRSVRNDVKLTKCHEMLWCEAAWGQLWPILCYEAGHKWTQPTLQCTSCAVCIGRHNCRHYNWLAAVSVLGCLQKQKKNTSFTICILK